MRLFGYLRKAGTAGPAHWSLRSRGGDSRHWWASASGGTATTGSRREPVPDSFFAHAMAVGHWQWGLHGIQNIDKSLNTHPLCV